MGVERERGEHIVNPDFTIISEGNIGEKARQLVDKTPQLKAIGFHVPRRTILAEGYFDRFLQRNGIGTTLSEAADDVDVAHRVRAGSFPLEDFSTLQRICLSYGSAPLMVRSSAEGDARGTGTYTSELSENNPGLVRKALQKVLASYFSESAVAFRRDAQVGEGFGVIVEPVVGQQQTKTWEYGGGSVDFFAPVLSGFGYTSTLKGEGYVNAVPGLGGGVDTKDGLKLTRTSLAESDGNLLEHLLDDRRTDRYSDPWERDKPLLLRRDTDGRTYSAPTRYQRRGSVYHQDMDLYKNEGFRNLNVLPVFEMMSRMEEAFGKPQYFEWAMTLEGDQPKYWILQIADVNKRVDHVDFEDYGDVLMMAHTVTGSGIKDCTKIANCWNPTDIDALNRFNQQNTDYALVYSSRLTTSFGEGRMRKLAYGDFSNASVFIEIQDAKHVGSPVAHLGGQLDVTGKLFGVLDYDAETPPQWDELRAGRKDEDGIEVYQGKVKVVASEKQDKMIVYKTTEPTDQ